jgi:hypothetical protein
MVEVLALACRQHRSVEVAMRPGPTQPRVLYLRSLALARMAPTSKLLLENWLSGNVWWTPR